jgi:GDSL-like Lipase/Acylhydrolase family
MCRINAGIAGCIRRRMVELRSLKNVVTPSLAEGAISRLALCAAIALSAVRVAAQASQQPTLEQELGEEVARFVEADRAAPPAACEVLFVGSSSIVNWKKTLARDMAPMPVINRGFGSSHIEYVNRWFDQIVAPYQPRAIVFYAGENDINAGKSVERVVADFDEFMKRKAQALGDTPVYFISLKPSKLRFAQFPQQSQVNEAVRQRAGRRTDLRYIDIVPAMLDDHGRPKDLFVEDGLHMNAAGYEIWTRVVRAVLLPNTEEQARKCHAKSAGPHSQASGVRHQPQR